jgi:hypothetical protein
VPASGGGTTNFLRADGNWASPPGTGGGLPYTDVTTTSQAMAVNNGYIADNAALVTLTLPGTAAVGSRMEVVGAGAGGWQIAQNAGQKIIFTSGGVAGTNETTTGAGGHVDSADRYNCIELICIVADTTFLAKSMKGNPTLT